MSNITTFADLQVAQSKLDNDVLTAQATIDFSVTNVAAADTVQVLKIPKGALVHNVYLTIITAEGGTATCDVGTTGGDPNGWDDSVDLNATANTLTGGIAGTDAFVVNNLPKLFAAADTVDLVIDNALATCVLEVTMKYHMSAHFRNA